MKPRPLWTGLGAIALLLIIAGPLLATLTDTTKPELKTPPLDAASASVSHFFDEYLDANGRIVDQNRDGGDTTESREQAYAMLLSAATGDRQHFDLIWGWTNARLLQPNGLLVTRWEQDAAVDPAQTSPGANLDAARALVVASRRFDDVSYAKSARRISDGLLAVHAQTSPNGRLYLRGEAGASESSDFVPGDHSPRAARALRELTGDQRWDQVMEGQRSFIDNLLDGNDSRLPPESAGFTTDGRIEPRNEGSSLAPKYANDAARLPVRLTESCDATDRVQAAKIWGVLNRSRDTRSASELDLDGSLRNPTPAVVNAVASAAGAKAAADELQMHSLLDVADDLEARRGTAYGAAWAALGRVMLTTTWLGEC